MALVLSRNAELVAEVLRGAQDDDPQSTMRAIAATRSLAAVVSDTLQALVDQARAEGRTWAEIGEVMHITRQAAFQRFGGGGGGARGARGARDAGQGGDTSLGGARGGAAGDGGVAGDEPDLPEDEPRAVPGATEHALVVLDRLFEGRFEQVRSDFDERMLKACPVEMLEAAVDQTRSQAGQREETGAPAVSVRHGYTVVDVPIAFERGDRTGRVVFNADDEVSGLFVLPPDAG